MTRFHAERIKGRNSRDIAHILGTPGRAEMIHRDDMALPGDRLGEIWRERSPRSEEGGLTRSEGVADARRRNW